MRGAARNALRMYLTLRYRRMWTKLALILLLAVNIPVIIIFFFLIKNSREAVRQTVFENHAQIAYRIGQEISEYIGTPRNILKNTAAIIAADRHDAWAQETILVNHVLNYPYFLRVTSIAPDGAVIADSDMDISVQVKDLEEKFGAVAGGDLYVSRVRRENGRFPFLEISAPIVSAGTVRGMLTARVNLRALWRIMDEIRLGSTGTVFVVSNEGLLIAAQDKKMVARSENLGQDPDVATALTGRFGSLGLDSGGKRWISSYAPVPGLGWGVVLRQEEREALSLGRKMQQESMLILVIIEFFVIALSVLLARQQARSLGMIARSMKEVADGNLEQVFASRRYDEMGSLFKSFNRMITKLRKARAMERFSSIGEASAGIAHEFKNSMVALKSFVQMFPRMHADKEFVRNFSALVPEEMRRWERMLKELSEFSSVDGLEKKLIPLAPVINDVLAMIAQDFNSRKIRVSFVFEDDEPVMADPERIRQVVMNIVLNAAQAMPAGGVLSIRKDSFKKEGRSRIFTRIRISDTGKGIPAEKIALVFEPFHSDKSGSLGLGLAISRRIIENHGGTITVDSRLGEGTSFTICLPRTSPV